MSLSSAFVPSRRTTFLAGLAIVSSACALSLAPTAAHANPASISASASTTDLSHQVDSEFVAALQGVAPGETTLYTIDNVTLQISNVNGRIAIDAPQDDARGVCAVTVASGLVLLGAAALASIAFATMGAGGAIIAGHVFTTSQIWAAAGLLGAWGALLTWVEGHICR